MTHLPLRGSAASDSNRMAPGQRLILSSGHRWRRASSSLEKRNMAYQLQWIPESTSKAQNGPEIDLKLGPEARPFNSSRGTHSSPYGNCQAGDKPNQFGAQINLFTAHGCGKFATVLTSLLHEKNHKVTLTTWASRAVSAQAIYIVLDDSEQPFLEGPSEALFQHIIKTIDSISNILWVSAQVGKVDTSSSKDLKSALLEGFARSARADYEQLTFTNLGILDESGKDLSAISHVVAEVVRRSLNSIDELEYVYREGQMLIPRLVPDRHINKIITQVGEPQLEEVLYIRSKDPLELDICSLQRPNGFYFTDGFTASGLPRPDEVEVEALAHPFDLRHIGQVKGRTPDPVPVTREFAGTVRAIGCKAQTTLKRGEAVIGWNLHSSAYANYPRTEICNVTRIPSHWSLSVAAAMAIPLMAGYYSLVETAKLRESQSIFIDEKAGL